LREESVTIPGCGHGVCVQCTEDLKPEGQGLVCPQDGHPFSLDEVTPISEPVKKLILGMRVSCEYSDFGCEEMVHFKELNQHLEKCPFNPDTTQLTCEKGCGAFFTRKERESHSCAAHLLDTIQSYDRKKGTALEEGKDSGIISDINEELIHTLKTFLEKQASEEALMRVKGKKGQTEEKRHPFKALKSGFDEKERMALLFVVLIMGLLIFFFSVVVSVLFFIYCIL
jgi:E3 ubiquitin-protein ligase NRDP1